MDNTKPMNIDLSKYGLREGFPEKTGAYSAFLKGYELGAEHERQKVNRG